MGNFIKGIIAVVIAAIALASTIYFANEGYRIIKEKRTECTPQEELTIDTISEPVITIQDVFEFRRSIIEQNHADSIFLTLPDIILYDILDNHGTHLSNYDISKIYEGNKEYYDSLLKGAKIKEEINKSDTAKLNTKDKNDFQKLKSYTNLKIL